MAAGAATCAGGAGVHCFRCPAARCLTDKHMRQFGSAAITATTDGGVGSSNNTEHSVSSDICIPCQRIVFQRCVQLPRLQCTYAAT